jgi:hypothetical protein
MQSINSLPISKIDSIYWERKLIGKKFAIIENAQILVARKKLALVQL